MAARSTRVWCCSVQRRGTHPLPMKLEAIELQGIGSIHPAATRGSACAPAADLAYRTFAQPACKRSTDHLRACFAPSTSSFVERVAIPAVRPIHPPEHERVDEDDRRPRGQLEKVPEHQLDSFHRILTLRRSTPGHESRLSSMARSGASCQPGPDICLPHDTCPQSHGSGRTGWQACPAAPNQHHEVRASRDSAPCSPRGIRMEWPPAAAPMSGHMETNRSSQVCARLALHRCVPQVRPLVPLLQPVVELRVVSLSQVAVD